MGLRVFVGGGGGVILAVCWRGRGSLGGLAAHHTPSWWWPKILKRRLSRNHEKNQSRVLRCLGARDSNHDPLANRIERIESRDLEEPKHLNKNSKDITGNRTEFGVAIRIVRC